VLAVLAFGSPGDRLARAVDELPWWLSALSLTALVVVLSEIVRLPISFWRGYLHERRWRFSTQGVPGWAGDRAKGLAIAVVLSGAGVVALVGLARAFPSAWPAVAAPGAAAIALLLSFVAPVVLEPIFNRFRPLSDESLAQALRALADRAGVPIRDVLVSDASRRTRKVNAYVSGVGATRRVVVYDTLIGEARPPEIGLVVAHELGHRRLRHVAKATALGMGFAVSAVIVLWALLRSSSVLAAVGAEGPRDPRVAPFVLFALAALELCAVPLGAAISRRWERQADRFSLELTQDVDAFEHAFRRLSAANLADPDPPRTLYLLTFTHPTVPERIAAARRWAESATVAK
jgi:STE24 endopeptidase